MLEVKKKESSRDFASYQISVPCCVIWIVSIVTSPLSFDSVLDESVIQRNIRIRYERELIYVSLTQPLVTTSVFCLFIHFIDTHLSYVPCFRLSQEVSWFQSTRTKCSTSTDWTWSRSTRAAHWAPCLRKSLPCDVDPVKFYKSYMPSFVNFWMLFHFRHLFAIGSASYGKMMKDTENQVLVIR